MNYFVDLGRWFFGEAVNITLAMEYGYGFVVLSFIAVAASSPKDLCHLFTHFLQDYFTCTRAIVWLSHHEGYRFNCIIILHHWTYIYCLILFNTSETMGPTGLKSPVHSLAYRMNLQQHANCASTATSESVRRSYHDLTARPSATLRRCYYDIGDRTTLLGRSRCVCCAHTASVRRSYGDHRRFAVYLAPFHGKIECLQHIFLRMQIRRYILKTNYDFIQVWIICFQISYNVYHKVINGQYWKLHMIVLFRSPWYKYHKSFRFYRVNFCLW